MACRGDVDTEDLERIVSIARSGENILCGYFKDFDGCLSVEQKEKVTAAVDFFEMLADHLETLTAAVEAMNDREEMDECEENFY